MQAVHPMFGADEMSSTLVSSFTSAERRMHSSPAARQPVPWRTMLSASLFVSGACVGYAMAVFQRTQHTPVPTVPLVEQKVASRGPAQWPVQLVGGVGPFQWAVCFHVGNSCCDPLVLGRRKHTIRRRRSC